MRAIPVMAMAALMLPVPAEARLEPSPAKLLSGYVAGKSQTCIGASQRDRSTRTFASGDILYQGSGTTWYLNHPRGCPEFRSQMAFVTDVAGSSLCNGDIVKLFDPLTHFFYGSCPLGDFVPYTRKERPR